MLQYAQLVRRLAMRLGTRLPPNVELDDLIQAGMIGLMEAANRYDKEGGASFETFAAIRINGAMIDELRAMDWCPRGLRQQSKTIERTIAQLEAELLRAPVEQEIAGHMGITLAELQQHLTDARGNQILYIEDLSGADDDGPVEFIADENAKDPLDTILSESLRQDLIRAIKALPERERQVMHLIYDEGLTQVETSKTLDLSEGRVSQIRSLAISRIRASLALKKPARKTTTKRLHPVD